MNNKKWLKILFGLLVALALLTPFWVFKHLLFPFVTSKAFYLRIVVELALPFYIYLIVWRKELRPSLKNPVTLSVLAFLLINLIAGIFGANSQRSFWGNFERMGGNFYLTHLTLLYFYVLLLGQINGEYMRKFLQAVVAVGTVVSLGAVMVKLTANHFLFNDPSYPRISATFGNPIFLASFLIIPLFLTVFFIVREEERWQKVLYGVAAAFQLYVIFLSATRGAIVGLAGALFVSAAVYIFLTPKKKLRLWGGGLLAAFVLLVGLAFGLHSKFPQGSLPARVFNLNDGNTKARLIQWKSALKGYKENPVLGVGAENYYVIANKYFDPAIYKYDPSWFDKPHNYLIEVLVTSGILGLLAYAAALLFFIIAVFKAYKSQLFGLTEFCILLAGFLAYQIQNLFVFDTVAASMAFFAFLGFGAFLWHESQSDESPQKTKANGIKGSAAANVAGVVSAVVVLYVIYVGNVFAIRIAKDINYGYAYTNVNPQTAKTYFETARNLPFNFDPLQFASKYADFANNTTNNPGTQTAEFVNKNLDDAIEVETQALAKVPNDATAWEQLSNLYLTKAIFNKSTLDPKAEEAAKKAISLAPNRPEPPANLARMYLFENKTTEAENLIKEVMARMPEDNNTKLELAVIYAYSKQMDKALALGQSVLDSGFQPWQATQIDWMGNNYANNGDFAAAAKIFEIALRLSPTNWQYKWNLALADSKIGKTDAAIDLARQLIEEHPVDAQNYLNFIDTLMHPTQ